MRTHLITCDVGNPGGYTHARRRRVRPGCEQFVVGEGIAKATGWTVEDSETVGCASVGPERVRLWDAINAFADAPKISDARMNAVVSVEDALWTYECRTRHAVCPNCKDAGQ